MTAVPSSVSASLQFFLDFSYAINNPRAFFKHNFNTVMMDLPPIEIHQVYEEQYISAFEETVANLEQLHNALLDETLPEEAFVRIRDLFINLIWYGTALTTPENLGELENEIEELLNGERENIENEYEFLDSYEADWSFMFDTDFNLQCIPCRKNFKAVIFGACKDIWRFVKKHKTELLMVSAVIITGGVTVYGALTEPGEDEEDPTAFLSTGPPNKPEADPSSTPITSPSSVPVSDAPIEEIASPIELYVQLPVEQSFAADIEDSLSERFAGTLSYLLLDTADQLLSPIDELFNEVEEITTKFFPETESSILRKPGWIKEALEVAQEKIDTTFDTTRPETHESFTIAELPYPGRTPGVTKLPKKTVARSSLKTTKNIEIFEKNSKHIFREATGHLKDTPSNRELLIKVTSNKNNYLGTDKYGNEWFAELFSDGSQIWTVSRKGKIRNGGINKTSRQFKVKHGFVKKGIK